MPRLMWRLGRRPRCAIAIRVGHRTDIVVIGTVIIVAVRLRSSAHLSKPVSGRLSKEINIAVSLLSKLCERELFAAPVRQLLCLVGKRCRLVRLLPLDSS